MNNDKKTTPPEDKGKTNTQKKNEHEKREREIDEEIEQSFPASDPPSYSQPGNEKKEEKE